MKIPRISPVSILWFAGAFATAGTLLSPTAFATLAGAPIQAGETMTVAISGNDTGCQDPGNNRAFSETGVLSVSSIITMGSGFVFTAEITIADTGDDGGAVVSLTSIPITADGSFSASGIPLVDTGPDPSSSTLALSGRLTSAGISASGTFAEDPPDTCTGPVSIEGTGVTAISPLSATSEAVFATEQQRTNVNTAQTVTRVAQNRLGVRRSSAVAGREAQTHQFKLSPGPGGMQLDAEAGLAAGDGQTQVSTWISASYGESESTAVGAAFDATRWSVLVGADVSPSDDWVLGVALGVDNTDVSTAFNQGGADITGWTIAPYVGVIWFDSLSVDASVGFSYTDTNQFRTLPVVGRRITSDVSGHRWFASTNATYNRNLGNWLFVGSAGLLYASNRAQGFTESNGTTVSSAAAKLGQLRLSGEVAYSFGALETFGRGTYEHDYSVTGAGRDVDEDGGQVALGLRYFGASGLSGSVEYSTLVGRENFNDDSVSATVRWDW